MDADFDRFYHRDLGETIWLHQWPGRKILARITGLPEDSAFRLARTDGWTTERELLASIHDRVTTTAHGWRLEGKPQPWPRPGQDRLDTEEAVDLSDPASVKALTRFFGRPRNN